MARGSPSGSETSSNSPEDSEDNSWTSSDESVDESGTMGIFIEQGKQGNMKFIEKFTAANEMNRTLVEEINRMRKRQAMPQNVGSKE
jgi:hypothetical protein